jgi:hypothetical protein
LPTFYAFKALCNGFVTSDRLECALEAFMVAIRIERMLFLVANTNQVLGGTHHPGDVSGVVVDDKAMSCLSRHPLPCAVQTCLALKGLSLQEIVRLDTLLSASVALEHLEDQCRAAGIYPLALELYHRVVDLEEKEQFRVGRCSPPLGYMYRKLAILQAHSYHSSISSSDTNYHLPPTGTTTGGTPSLVNTSIQWDQTMDQIDLHL